MNARGLSRVRQTARSATAGISASQPQSDCGTVTLAQPLSMDNMEIPTCPGVDTAPVLLQSGTGGQFVADIQNNHGFAVAVDVNWLLTVGGTQILVEQTQGAQISANTTRTVSEGFEPLDTPELVDNPGEFALDVTLQDLVQV